MSKTRRKSIKHCYPKAFRACVQYVKRIQPNYRKSEIQKKDQLLNFFAYHQISIELILVKGHNCYRIYSDKFRLHCNYRFENEEEMEEEALAFGFHLLEKRG